MKKQADTVYKQLTLPHFNHVITQSTISKTILVNIAGFLQ